MNRRNLAMGGVAAAAGLAGVGAAWWKFRPHELAPQPAADRVAVAPGADTGTQSDDAIEAFWKSSFDTPEGTPLAMSSARIARPRRLVPNTGAAKSTASAKKTSHARMSIA